MNLKLEDPGWADDNSFATFSDPDSNSWLIQEVKKRAPGRRRQIQILDLYERPARLRRCRKTSADLYSPGSRWRFRYALRLAGVGAQVDDYGQVFRKSPNRK